MGGHIGQVTQILGQCRVIYLSGLLHTRLVESVPYFIMLNTFL